MKKKIAFFTPTIFAIGGESRVVTVIANELSKNYDITIFTREKKITKSIYDLNENIRVISYYPYSKLPIASIIRYFYRKKKILAFEKNIKLLEYAYYSDFAIKKMRKLISTFFDIAIAVSGDMTILLGKCKLNDIRTIGWEHSSYEAYFETPHKYLWKRDKIFVEAVEGLDKCVVLNEDIAEKYYENLGIKCEYIYNPRSFTSSKKSKLLNKQFIACGNFVDAKGFDLLIESFKIFALKNKDWKLFIVGDGLNFLTLHEKVCSYKLQDRIILPGYLNDVRPLLLESSVYLLSSRWEGFPMCVTEAYEIGLPVICYDIPAMIPLVRNKEGLIIEKYDHVSFASAMLELAENEGLRSEMSENAKKMADSLSIENIGDEWLKLLEKN